MDYTEERLKVTVKARAGRQKGRRRAAGRREGSPLLTAEGGGGASGVELQGRWSVREELFS